MGFDPASTAREVLEHATGRRGSLTLAALGDGRVRLADVCGGSDPDAYAAASQQDRDGAKTTLLSSCCVRPELRFNGRTVDQGRYRCDAAVAEVIEDVLREAESFAVR